MLYDLVVKLCHGPQRSLPASRLVEGQTMAQLPGMLKKLVLPVVSPPGI